MSPSEPSEDRGGNVLDIVRAGIIDDHEAVPIGFAALAARDARLSSPPVRVKGASPGVMVFLDAGRGSCDVVALDISLAHGSRAGKTIASQELAAAIEVDAGFVNSSRARW